MQQTTPARSRGSALAVLCRPRVARPIALALLGVSLLAGSAVAQRGPGAPTTGRALPIRATPAGDEAERCARATRALPPDLTPRPRRRLRFREGTVPASFRDIATMGTYASAIFSLRSDRPSEPSWTRVNRFDGFLRERLELRGHAGTSIGLASDVLLYTAAAFPSVIDDLVLALVADRNRELAGKLVAIDSQAFALTGLLAGIASLATARERPGAQGASTQGEPNAGGGTSDRNVSFFSEHAAMAFTGASLACFHQQQIAGLYGTRAAGLAVCASAMAVATAASLFDVMADESWATDMLAGAAVGLFSGWLVPWLMHGRTLLRFDGAYLQGSVGPMVNQTAFGLRGRVYF